MENKTFEEKVISCFSYAISKSKKDSTYKFALGRFILDKSKSYKFKENFEDISAIKIEYEEIAESFLRYYWNQIIVFDLKQDFKLSKEKIIEENKDLSKLRSSKIFSILNNYKIEHSNQKLDLFDIYFNNKKLIITEKKKREKDKINLIKVIKKECLKEVVPRFQEDNQLLFKHNIPVGKRKSYPKKDQDYILLNLNSLLCLSLNYNLLYDQVILNWSRFLEKTNKFSFEVINKVELLGLKERKSLKSFRKKLLELVDNPKCFYCNNILNLNDIHVDHFIPWSYVFEDNLWNLVLSCSSCNQKKSNKLPSINCLNKLKKRNKTNINFFIGEDIINTYYENYKTEYLLKEFETKC